MIGLLAIPTITQTPLLSHYPVQVRNPAKLLPAPSETLGPRGAEFYTRPGATRRLPHFRGLVIGALRPHEGESDGAEIEEIGDEDLGAERTERLGALIVASHDRADREALLQKEPRRHAGAADQDEGGGHIGGASNAYLPWISMPSGARGPTGMKSKSIRPAWPSGRKSAAKTYIALKRATLTSTAVSPERSSELCSGKGFCFSDQQV
jgi:hypothetical protein